jgi:hypothetical protein
MPDIAPTRNTLLKRLDEAGWPLVVESVISGVCHDLNGRVNSLASLTYLLNSGGEWAKSSGVVEEELQRLEELSRLLRTLTMEEAGPKPLALSDSLPSLVSLVQVQPGLGGVRVDLNLPPDLPAIRLDQTLFTRCVLLVLSAVAEEASDQKQGFIEISGDSGVPRLRIRPARRGVSAFETESDEPAGNRLPQTTEAIVGAVLEGVGGRLVSSGDAAEVETLELWFPGLTG